MTTLVRNLTGLKIPPIDGAWLAVVLILIALGVFAPAQLPASIVFTLKALANTAPYILFAVLAVAYLKASGAESIVAKAFEGRQVRMIVLAAMMGGLSPFCSCEVIPFVAGLLALGTPIAPVMAFWLSSPLMDPAAFAITAGSLGFQFAIAKTVVAVSMGLFGGFAMYAARRQVGLTSILSHRRKAVAVAAVRHRSRASRSGSSGRKTIAGRYSSRKASQTACPVQVADARLSDRKPDDRLYAG